MTATDTSQTALRMRAKRGAATAGLAVVWFALWLALLSLLIAPTSGLLVDEANPWTRLWLELAPLIAVVAATWITCRWIDRSTPWPRLLSRGWWPGVGMAAVSGLGWLAASAGALMLLGALRFGSGTDVPLLSVWLTAAFLNVVMQEYLVRGYLFSVLASRHSTAVAVTVTTVLFVALHGFSGGVLGVINVAVANLVFTLLLLRTGGLLAPIIAHALWNLVGGPVLGVVSLGGVYPAVLSPIFEGHTVLTGGELMLEGAASTTLTGLLTITLLRIWRPEVSR